MTADMVGPVMLTHRAHELPDIRADLDRTCTVVYQTMDQNVERWRKETGDDNIGIRGLKGQGIESPRRVAEDCEWISYCLEHAALWYVADPMVDLLVHAWPSLPPATLTPELMPDEYGLVVFGHPIEGKAADLDQPLIVDGYVWGPVTVVKGDEEIECVGIAAVRYATVWGPLGCTSWTIGTDTDDVLMEEEEASSQRAQSMIEDRRMMAALWLLSSQPNIAEHGDAPLPRHVRRRAEREGKPVPKVKLIDLRRPRHTPSPTAEHVEVHWSRRWMVGGHWRQQAWGPGRQYRRPTWIAPYVKGPEDKPLIVPDAVKVWRQ